MRVPRRTAALLVACGLAVAGCGGGSDDESTTTTTAAGSPTATATTATETTDTATATATATTGATATATETATSPSGGTPVDPGTSTATTQAAKPSGDQPRFTVSGSTARAVAPDSSFPSLWCDAARQGSYDDQIGSATKLVFTVSGSDDATVCQLGR